MKLKRAGEGTLVIEVNRHNNSEVSKKKMDMEVREFPCNLKV